MQIACMHAHVHRNSRIHAGAADNTSTVGVGLHAGRLVSCIYGYQY